MASPTDTSPVAGVEQALKGLLSTSKISRQELHYDWTPTAGEFHMDSTFFRGVMGPVGSGKSVMCCLELWRRAKAQAPDRLGNRRTRFVIVRNTFSQLKTTTIKTFLDWFPFTKIVYDSPIRAEWDFVMPDGTKLKSELYFLPLDKESDIEKVMSLEITGGWVNEARFVPWPIISGLRKRCGRYPSQEMGGCTWRGLWADTNPPSTRHWWYDLAENKKPRGFRFWHQPPALLIATQPEQWRGKPHAISDSGVVFVGNPAAENIDHLDGGYGYYFRNVPGEDMESINVYLLAQYGVALDGRAVYEGHWVDSLHASKAPLKWERGLPVVFGADFGHTPCVVAGQQTPNGQLRVLREYRAEKAGIRQLVETIVLPSLVAEWGHVPTITGWGDPAGAAGGQADIEINCISMLTGLGLPCEPAPTNQPDARIESVTEYLNRLTDGKPGFLLDSSCEVLREGFLGAYRYRKLRVHSDTGPKYGATPEKDEFSHPHDALQYLCSGLRIGNERSRRRAAKNLPMVGKRRNSVWKAY